MNKSTARSLIFSSKTSLAAISIPVLNRSFPHTVRLLPAISAQDGGAAQQHSRTGRFLLILNFEKKIAYDLEYSLSGWG